MFRAIGRHHPLYRRASALLEARPAALWARRSIFLREDVPLLVTEVFLPAILELPRVTLRRAARAYERLMRLDKPIGILLLLWPTLWGLWIAGEGRPDRGDPC